MGDVGSQFIGLLWAVLLLIPSQEAHASTMNFSVYTVPLLFFSFIYDVSMTVIRRIWRREAFGWPTAHIYFSCSIVWDTATHKSHISI
ncbi:MAG: hypothetical protein H6925_03730 [Holosporaceae bacterium]|nr:MAG: hypothetical protein H6925_03730 [Holosporaceae bacterium]